MHVSDVQHAPISLATAEDDFAQADYQIGECSVPEGFVLDVLAALAEMALRSKRRQADLDAALRHAGIAAARPRMIAAVDRARSQGWVDKVIELADGGVLLSVTARGLERLGGARGLA